MIGDQALQHFGNSFGWALAANALIPVITSPI
jgi:hypothetical protein